MPARTNIRSTDTSASEGKDKLLQHDYPTDTFTTDKPTIRDGQLPASSLQLIRKDVAHVLTSLGEKNAARVVDCFAKLDSTSSDIARRMAICRTLLGEHLNYLVKMIPVFSIAPSPLAGRACEKGLYAGILVTILHQSAYAHHLPFDYVVIILRYCIPNIMLAWPAAELSSLPRTAGRLEALHADMSTLVLTLSRFPAVGDHLDASMLRIAEQHLPRLHHWVHCVPAQNVEEERMIRRTLFWLAALQFFLGQTPTLTDDPKLDDFFRQNRLLSSLSVKSKALADASSLFQIFRMTGWFVCLACLKFRNISIPCISNPICTKSPVIKTEEFKGAYSLCQNDGATMVCSKECFANYWSIKGHKKKCSQAIKGGSKQQDRPDWRTTYLEITGCKADAL